MDNNPNFLTEAGFASLSAGYLLEGETVRDACWRISNSVAFYLKKPELAEKFFDYSFNKGWLAFSSPVWANVGTSRGLPISCYSYEVLDSLAGIYESYKEAAMLTKYGGGLGCDWNSVRARGSQISQNGKSNGVISWLKILDSIMWATSQGGVRRGNAAPYLSVDHGDFKEFLQIRKPKGDINRQCQNLHHGAIINDAFMKRCKAGDRESISLWNDILYTRLTTGEPYMMFIDNVQKADPIWYKDKGLSTKTSNLCSEIMLHTDEDHTFVCCLSSMNLSKWEEWKDTDAVKVAIWFLDGVMEEFIQKARDKEGFRRSVRFAEKSRALGLGVLGWHTLLQQKMIPFEDMQALFLNKMIFKKMKDDSETATNELAKEYGTPEWLKGYGRRNSHCLAIAPTVTNSVIAGQVSQGIEPIAANIFIHKTAKGNFIVKNQNLMKVLDNKNKNNSDIWNEINSNGGSVKTLDFLSEEEKNVFKTAREINQFVIIKQAADRQQFIDQGQSVNVFFTYPDPETKRNNPGLEEEVAQYIHNVHKTAWESGLKSLYYFRSEGAAKADVKIRKEEDCVWCS